MYAVIRLRGSTETKKEMEDALCMLRLHHVNCCVIIPKNPNSDGMVKKVKEYITWGEVKPEMLEKLISKRGRLTESKKLDKKDVEDFLKNILKEKSTKNIKNLKQVFRLSPPSKGLKSIKSHYPKGDLGYRGEKINDLLERMI